MITETSKKAARALFRGEVFIEGNTNVTVSKDTAVLHVKGDEIARLRGSVLEVKNGGNFGAAVLDRINGVLHRAGHEVLYRKSWCWVFENSQTPFGDGLEWKKVKL